MSAYKRNRNRAIISRIKNTPCTDCGQILPPEAMDFDHVAGVKDKRFLAGWTHVTLTQLRRELAKCEVVCVYCHKRRTVSRFKQTKKPLDYYFELKNQKCSLCDFHPNGDIFLMEFDHIEDNKSFNVCRFAHAEKHREKVEEEIKKCRLLCCACHRVATKTRSIDHVARNRYDCLDDEP